MELNNNHRKALLEELDMAISEFTIQKELLNEKQEQYKESYEVKMFLAQMKVELIQNTIVKNEIEYKKVIF